MRRRFLVGLAIFWVLAAASAAGERYHGRGDTSRQGGGEKEVELTPGYGVAPRRGRVPAEELDPAVKQFWSDRCVNQRRFGRSHTGDCDHPAYSGGGYSYRGYRPDPYAPRADTVIINRGGTVVMPRRGGAEHPRPGGGLIPYYRR
ncbi:MAG: hypothetical protein U9Q81_14730 [Pseudomonadota bacterium]|nr:hypothetical protein [Pseudomonadota bacterium]